MDDPEKVLKNEVQLRSFYIGMDGDICGWGDGKTLPDIATKKTRILSHRINQKKNFKIKKKNNRQTSLVETFSPSKSLCKELKNILKQPSLPDRDLKRFRKNIRVAIGKSKTIEELLKLTKIPASKLVRSTETNTSPRISPLKQFDMYPTFRLATKKLF